MRVIQIVLLSAILGALAYIAIDLHRLTLELGPTYRITNGLVNFANPPARTREQRIRDMMATDKAFDDEMAVIGEASRRESAQRRAQPKPIASSKP